MTMKVLLGTYTRGASEGVYRVDLNLTEKKLENLSLVAEVGSPTYLATNEDDSIIYTIVSEGDRGGIAALVQQADRTFERKVEVLEEGASPAYIAYDSERHFVYTSNYHKGELSVYQTDETGQLKLADRVAHSGSSVHENQASPHVHYSDLSPDGKYLIVCDLGTDGLYTYETDQTGQLTEIARLTVAAGSGPRHIVFHPQRDIAYLFAELSSEVIVLDYNTETGEFTEKQTIATIPSDHTTFNSGAAIRVSKDGRFLYASNRGHNSIVTFEIADDGKIALLDYTPTAGETPRDFNLDPTNQFLIVGHQDSDNLTLFARDETNGSLSLLQQNFFAPEVVNIHF